MQEPPGMQRALLADDGALPLTLSGVRPGEKVIKATETRTCSLPQIRHDRPGSSMDSPVRSTGVERHNWGPEDPEDPFPLASARFLSLTHHLLCEPCPSVSWPLAKLHSFDSFSSFILHHEVPLLRSALRAHR